MKKMACGCSRRQFVRLSLGAGLAAQFGMSPWLAAQEGRGPAKRGILLFMWGAPSQLDTFDPKPGADTGGEFKAIETAAPGIQISEHLPRIAAQMKNISLIRTLNSRDPNHDTAQYMLHTGYRKAADLEHPHVGSIVSSELGETAPDLPGCVVIGADPPVGSGYLPADKGPIIFDRLDAPAEDVLASPSQSRERLEKRWKLLSEFESRFAAEHEDARIQARRRAYDKAYKVLTSERVKAFDVSKEPEATRLLYGDSPVGRACLMARRLIEGGVRFVEVMFGSWDTHDNNFGQVRDLCKQIDPAFAGLVQDLKARRLLDETLVAWTGEFGRTPRINASNGRDHWTRNFCAALAGGGIQGGRVVGRTDESGAEITERPVSVGDFYATIYRCFGIDGSKKLPAGVRPMKILESGDPVKELF
jgi:hypothetical protein